MSRTQHPIDLIEEAIHLLRRAPIETYAFFLLGIAPFVLCFFRFCSEMSYSEFAESSLPGFAATLALSYLWMKAFQYLACRQLVMVYTGELSNRENFGRILKSCIHQAAIHPAADLAIDLIRNLDLVPENAPQGAGNHAGRQPHRHWRVAQRRL